MTVYIYCFVTVSVVKSAVQILEKTKQSRVSHSHVDLNLPVADTDKVALSDFLLSSVCLISASSMEKVVGLYGESIKVPCNNGDNKPSNLMFTKWKHVSIRCSSCLNLSVLDHWRAAVGCQENQPHG